MNGRCDNDPLDPADDVCDLCGGEFCELCLVERTKRTRQTVCLECSLVQAKVRPGKIVRVRSKREGKKRRKEIRDERDSMQDEGRFVFFDDHGAKTTPSEPTSTKRTLSGRNQTDEQVSVGGDTQPMDRQSSDPEAWINQIDDLIEPEEVEQPVEEEFAVPLSPAVERLERLRSEGPETPTPPAALRPRPTAPTPAPAPEPVNLETPDSSNYDGIDPFAVSPMPESEPELSNEPDFATFSAEDCFPEPEPVPMFDPRKVPPVATPATAEVAPASLGSNAGALDEIEVPEVFRQTPTVDTSEPVVPNDTDSSGEWIPPILRG